MSEHFHSESHSYTHIALAVLGYVLNSFFPFKRYVDFISILPANLEKDGPYIVNYSNFLHLFFLRDDIFLDVSITLVHST